MWHGYHPNIAELIDISVDFQNFKTFNWELIKCAEPGLKVEQNHLTNTEIVKRKQKRMHHII